MSNASPTEKTDNADPDIPPEVMARQSKARGLTAETVELIGGNTVRMHDDGQLGERRRTEQKAEAVRAAARAEEFAGPTPTAGLTPDQIAAVKNMEYPRGEFPSSPVMGPLGDRDPEWINWLWAISPKAASIRYAYRPNCSPTRLPKVWPPKADPFVLPKPDVTATLAASTPGQGFTLEQVSQMVASASKNAAEAAVAAVLAAQAATKPAAPAVVATVPQAPRPPRYTRKPTPSTSTPNA